MLAWSFVSGVTGGLLGFVQKFVEKKQSHNHQVEMLKLNQKHNISLLEKQVPIEEIKLSQENQKVKQDEEESYQAYLEFAKDSSNTNTTSQIVNFLNGATRPLITYLDRIVFLMIFFCLKGSLSNEIIDELLFVVLDLIIFENAFWFGHKNSDRLFSAVDRMRTSSSNSGSADVKKK